MNHTNSVSDQIQATIGKLSDIILIASDAGKQYLAQFHQNIQENIFSDSDEPIHAYYLYVETLTKIIPQTNACIANLAKLMKLADRDMQTDAILTCDRILNAYLKIQSSVNHFLNVNEALLHRKDASPSVYKMNRYARELQCSFDLFYQFLKEEQHIAP